MEQQLLAGARCRVGVHNSSVRRYPAPASQPFLSIINKNKPVFSFTFGYLKCKYKNKHSTLRCTVAIYCGSLDIFLVFFQLMILDSLRWSVAIWRQRYTSDRSWYSLVNEWWPPILHEKAHFCPKIAVSVLYPVLPFLAKNSTLSTAVHHV